MEKLRIALVSDWYRPRKGGVETSIYNIAKTLLKRGHEPIVVTHQYKNYDPRDTLEFDDGIPVVRFKVNLKEDSDDVTISLKAGALLHDFLKHNAIDLVHGHSLVSPFAHMAIHIGKGILGIPGLVTHHSLLYGEISFPQKLLLKFAASKADLITAVSTASAEDAEKILNRSVVITHNCIILDEWRNTIYDPLEGDPAVLLVSRLIPRKRPFLALRAFATLAKDIRKARLYIIGSGPLAPDIMREVERYGLENNVVMVGQLPHSLVKKYMAGGDLLLLPSNREAFPMAALEAQALGLPVIGFSQTGLQDIIINGVNGVLVDSDLEFIEKTVSIGSDRTVLSTMSKEALREIERFDCDNIYANEYSNAYKSALDSCEKEKRYLLYKLFRIVKLNPVKPGEWCRGRREEHAEMPPKRSSVPYLRRRARRSAIPVFKHTGNT